MAKTAYDSYFKGHDAHRLYYERHAARSPKAVLVVVHGLNEHSGRYKPLLDALGKKYTIYIYDHRGHGRSDGVRAHVDDFDQLIADLREFVELVAKQENQKIFLIGHSMGGQIVVNFMAKYPEAKVYGFITSSANLRIGVKINPVKKFLGMKAAGLLPRLKLKNEIDPRLICTDMNVVREYKRDPLVTKFITTRLAAELLKNQDNIMAMASRIHKPALLLHGGDDSICDPSGTEEFCDRLASEDKTVKLYPGMYHEIFNEPENAQVFSDILAWLGEHA